MKLFFIMFFVSAVSVAGLASSTSNSSLINLENSEIEGNSLAKHEVSEAFDVFSEIERRFETGQSVSYESVNGFYAGRCYDMVTRTKPVPSLLGIYQRDNRYDNGPGFPSDGVKKAIEMTAVDAYADHFDHFNVFQARNGLNQFWKQFNEIENFNGTISSTTIGNEHKNRVVFRRSTDYLVLASVALQNMTRETVDGEKMIVLKGDIWMACYYFKKL